MFFPSYTKIYVFLFFFHATLTIQISMLALKGMKPASVYILQTIRNWIDILEQNALQILKWYFNSLKRWHIHSDVEWRDKYIAKKQKWDTIVTVKLSNILIPYLYNQWIRSTSIYDIYLMRLLWW